MTEHSTPAPDASESDAAQSLTTPTTLHPAWTVTWVGAVSLLFVTPAITGLAGIIIVILTMIGAGLYFGFKHGPSAILGNRFAQVMTLAYALILISFLINARTPHDLLFLANFLGILSAPALYYLARRHSGIIWTRRIVLMAAVGAVIIFGVSVYDIGVQNSLRAGGIILFGPNQMGQFALLLGAISLGGMMVWKSIWVRLFLVLAAALSGASILLAGSRIVAITTLATLVVAAVFGLSSKMNLGRWAMAIVLLIIAGGSLFAVSKVAGFSSDRIFATVEQVQQVLDQGYSDDHNIQIRLDLYQSGFQSFFSSPLTGVGWSQALEAGSVVTAADEHLGDYYRTISYPLMHNDFIGFASSMGLIGLFAYLLMVVAPWMGLNPRDSLFRFRFYLLMIMVCVFHIFALTDVSLTLDIGIVAYVMMSSLILGTFRENPIGAGSKTQTPT